MNIGFMITSNGDILLMLHSLPNCVPVASKSDAISHIGNGLNYKVRHSPLHVAQMNQKH